MATISKLTVGQTLYSVERVKMGNTTQSRNAVYHVLITAIDPDGKYVDASWNGNRARRYYARSVSKWRVKRPEPKTEILGLPNY